MLFSFIALGCTEPLRGQCTPPADLLNVQFNIDGSAVDLSPSLFHYRKRLGESPIVAYDATVKKYVARFLGKSGSFFKINYQGNTAFQDKIQQAFTLEVYTRLKASGTMDIVSSQESGGFGLEQSSAGPTEMWFGYEGGYYTKAGGQSLYNATTPT